MEIILSNRQELLKNIKQVVINTIFPEVIEENEIQLKEKVEKLFIERMKDHRVVRGLLGDYAGDETRDLQAIFGLTDGDARSVVAGMENLVQRLMTITIKVDNVVRVNFTLPDIEELFEVEYGTYSYYSKKFKDVIIIPFGEWLFEGGRTEAGITFDVEAFPEAFSRSDRAIMTDQEEPWEFSPLSVSRTGSVFLDVVRSGKFREAVRLEMIELLLKRLNNG